MNDCESSGSTLVVLSAAGNSALDFLERVLSMHGHHNTWIVVDRKTMEMLSSRGFLQKVPSDRVIVYTGRNPEELVLRVYVLSKPSRVYVCNELGVLKPFVEFLEVAPVELETC